jgi:nitrous oxide reductase accessory protein NosL
MKLPPSIKGSLTKANKLPNLQEWFTVARAVFAKLMAPEQAKHVTRRFLSAPTTDLGLKG